LYPKSSSLRQTAIRDRSKALGAGVKGTGLTRRHAKQIYLFSGLLVCGECGGSSSLVGGRANTKRSEYGCSLRAQRGDSVCKNDLRIQRHGLEGRLLAGRQARVLREEFIDYVICGLRDESRQRHEALNSELKQFREEKHRIEVELKRLVDMIAAGTALPTVMSAISERARIRFRKNSTDFARSRSSALPNSEHF
jgi:Recombinase zinc beta ribbon domain